MNFEKITGKKPYAHQQETYSVLADGQSVILRAPTGSGKTEAVFVPFLELRGKILPSRMVYALPMRALVNSISSRISNYAGAIQVKAQHGEKLESLYFDADCVVATLDQVITSYACAPLSLGVRYGNIPAGAIAGSFLVFDEVHTFNPELGLQSSLILAERMKGLGLPFVFMTATLPTEFMKSLAERLGARIIEADEESLPVRKLRNVFLISNINEMLSPENILTYYKENPGRLIVVCNTVSKAVELYQQLKEKIRPQPILIHSRFFDEDRARIEKEIERLFGIKGPKEAVLITTQVVEVGMDISADLVLTELAPIDSLIQRAGRCCRWGGKGKFIVFGVSDCAPYKKSVMDSTKDTLSKIQPQRLSWELEKSMVDQILDKTFNNLAYPHAAGKAMWYLSEGAFKGSSSIVENAVRDSLSIEVSIHDNPSSLGKDVMSLPKCKILPSTLKKLIYKLKAKVWAIEIDKEADDDYNPRIDVVPICSVNKIFPNKFYVIHNSYACYSQEEGLILGKSGQPLLPCELKEDVINREQEEIPVETWKEHAINTVKVFEEKILPTEDLVFSKLASWLDENKETILNLVRLILILHDLGKLNKDWQKIAGTKDSFLAHSGKIASVKFPPHATISAYVLGDYLRQCWRNILGEAAFFAIAHHHSVRAVKVPKYRLSDGWFDEVKNTLSELTDIKLPWEWVKNFEAQKVPTRLSKSFPAFEKEKTYTAYVVFSRSLRLSDREATSNLKDNDKKKRDKQ
ncbi:MAG: CRISPR-associated helicase Cas3' [Candidatus Aminicenantes bacterium]|nr:CRISPR-associated helicase Cas3' [Candidatus Aminicenantes bacterium]